MKVKQHFQQALMNIMSAKLRSFLAVLGILVGTASVVALVSSGQLATNKALEQIKVLGSDLMAVNAYNRSSKKDSGVEDFEQKHITSMQQLIDEVNIIAPYSTVYVNASANDKKLSATTIGTTAELQKIIKINLNRGRFISFMDTYEYFCVLGWNIYNKIPKNQQQDIIGKQVKLGNFYYTVIGIADPWAENNFFNANINNAILIPLQSANVLSKHVKIRDFIIKLDADSDLDAVEGKIRNFMHSISPSYKLFFRSARQIIKSIENQSGIFTLLLGLIGGISLLVGGIGVMNVMLVSVVERKREIGIRKAVGARRQDIRTLFLIEAVTLSVLGGFIGIILGVAVSYVIAIFTNWGFTIFVLPPLLGFLVSVATGIFFGFYPAHRAAKLDPIQTLRYE